MRTWRRLWALAGTFSVSSTVTVCAGRPNPAPTPVTRTAAVMPALYFSADPTSAAALTEGLRQELLARGWQVVSPTASAAAAQAVGIQRRAHQPDWKALAFGRRLNADVIVYPRLLALGVGVGGPSDVCPDPAAVLFVRVLDARTGRCLYSRQVAHPLKELVRTSTAPLDTFTLTPETGRAAAITALAGFRKRPQLSQ